MMEKEKINHQNDRILLKNFSKILAWFWGNSEEKGNTPKEIGSLKMSSTSLQAHNQWKVLEEGSNSNIAARSSQIFSNICKIGKGPNIAASSRIQNLQSSSKIPSRPRKGSTLLRAPNPKTCKRFSGVHYHTSNSIFQNKNA